MLNKLTMCQAALLSLTDGAPVEREREREGEDEKGLWSLSESMARSGADSPLTLRGAQLITGELLFLAEHYTCSTQANETGSTP